MEIGTGSESDQVLVFVFVFVLVLVLVLVLLALVSIAFPSLFSLLVSFSFFLFLFFFFLVCIRHHPTNQPSIQQTITVSSLLVSPSPLVLPFHSFCTAPPPQQQQQQQQRAPAPLPLPFDLVPLPPPSSSPSRSFFVPVPLLFSHPVSPRQSFDSWRSSNQIKRRHRHRHLHRQLFKTSHLSTSQRHLRTRLTHFVSLVLSHPQSIPFHRHSHNFAQNNTLFSSRSLALSLFALIHDAPAPLMIQRSHLISRTLFTTSVLPPRPAFVIFRFPFPVLLSPSSVSLALATCILPVV